MKTNRVKNSIFNGLSNLILNISVAILSFVVRTYFIRILGEQCLGLDGLFTNILSFLSLAELGFSTSVSFSLYKPLAEKNDKKVNELMTYFKKVYQKIGFAIFLGGIGLLPFLSYIAKDYNVSYNIYFIFLLYLINTAASYYVSYITILLEADQKSYKLTGIKFTSNIITYGLQLLVLLYFNSFILYLLIQLIFRMLERVVIFLYIKKYYPNLNFNNKEMINKKDKKSIMENIKGILYHKVGEYAVNGTDNILISSIINITTTGIYYNYLSIVSIFRNLISAIINAATASFGNLNVTEKEEVKENVFDIINFLCCVLSGVFVIGIYFCINPFITLWVGEKFLLDSLYVVIICINLYLNCILLPINTVKNSSGLYYVDRYVPIVQAVINLFISILLGIKIGLLGIFLGTLISSILTVNWTKPYIIYKYIFKNDVKRYFAKIFKNIICIFLSVVLASFFLNRLELDSPFWIILLKGSISVSIYFVICYIMYAKSKEFKYMISIIRKKKQ